MLRLIASIERQRWQPSAVLGQSGPLQQRLRADGVPVSVIDIGGALRSVRRDEIGIGKYADPRVVVGVVNQVVRLRRALRAQQVDLVHTNSLKACVLGGTAGRLAGIPVVWQVHSIVSSEKMKPAAVRLMRRMARWLPAAIVCNSAATAACFPGNPRVAVVPCGIDSRAFHPNGARPHNRTWIGMVARMSPEKGQHILLDAAEMVSGRAPCAEYVVAGTALFGEDGYERAIRNRTSQPPLADRVRLAGFVDDVPSFLQDLDIVVSPSTEPEGFGQIVAEAMMTGKPVIASSAGGTAELIDDGVTGRLVPPGDAQALADAIEDLIDHPAKAAEMGRRAREVALERYDIRRTTRAIEAVYERVLARA